jgi:uncharacterized membrane protein
MAIPWITQEGLLDTTFERIRHYARGDFAVSLRLLRAFDDILLAGLSAKEAISLLERERRVVRSCEQALPDEDLARLHRRLKQLGSRVLAAPAS